jgi:hypothetical protein
MRSSLLFLNVRKTCAARTLLFAIVTFATLSFSSSANGDLIITSGQQQNYGLSGVAQSDAFVDWSKPARDQSGPTEPQYEGRGTP